MVFVISGYLLSTVKPPDGTIYGLDFDWTAGNIYMASEDGYVLTCDAKLALESSLGCTVLVQSFSNFYGIAIDPIER